MKKALFTLFLVLVCAGIAMAQGTTIPDRTAATAGADADELAMYDASATTGRAITFANLFDNYLWAKILAADGTTSTLDADTLDGEEGSYYQPQDAFLDDFAALTDPGADRLSFWDDSAGGIVWLTLGTNLSITGTTLNASGGSGSIEDDAFDATWNTDTDGASKNSIFDYVDQFDDDNDGDIDGEALDIANATTETNIAADDLIILYDTSATANRAMTRGNFVTGIGAGQAIELDFDDDGSPASTDIGEIATNGDTNDIFTEPLADKLYIDLEQNWPTADAADSASSQVITDNAIATVDDADAADNDFAKFTANGLEGRSYAEARADLSLDSAANLETSLSLGAYASDILGSANSDALVTLLELAAGDIPDISATYEAVDAEIARFDTADTVGADWEWQDNIPASFGNDNDWEVDYDTDISDNDSDFNTALTGAGLVFETANAAADAKVIFNNSDATYGVDLYVEDIYYSGSLNFDGTGDSYITLTNNASIEGSGYQIFFEAGNLISVENGDEKELLNAEDGATLTGTSWDFSSVTNLVLPTAAADASGELSMSTGNQLKWHDGAKVVTIDTTATDDNYVLKYDNASATFNLEADATGGTPAWSDVTDAEADTAIDHDAGEETAFTYTGNYSAGAQFLIQQLTGNPTGGTLFEVRGADADSGVFEAGDGTNVWTISTAGLLSNAGTATLNLAAASDLTIAGGQIDFDDLAQSGNATPTGTWDYSGATVDFSNTLGQGDLSTNSVAYSETNGSIKSLTPVTDDADNFAANFTGTNLYGGTFVANAAGDVDLPAPVAGMNFTVITMGDIEVDALPTAGDDLLLDGVQLDDNHDASNTGSAGDIAVFQYYDADGWLVTTNGWTEVAD